MSVIIASDIHGSKYYLEKLIEKYKEEKVDEIILLGDIYYHGPRNPLPTGYNPMGVSEILNELTDKLTVIHGNCDSEVDQMISKFTFVKHKIVNIDNKKLFITHGHVYNEDNFPPEDFDILAYGHFHVSFLKEKCGKIIMNPGSLSLPKNDTKPGYILIKDGIIFLKTLDGEILNKVKI